MKTSIEHLPFAKQQELTTITTTIVRAIKPVMVILFGSYSRGDWVEHEYTENGTTYSYKSDFDLLVVTKKEKDIPAGLSKQIRKMIRNSGLHDTPLSPIFHSIEFLNKELEEGNYFFADVIREGTELFNNGKFALSTPKTLNPAARAQKARVYYDNWFNSGNEFLIDYNNAFNRGSYTKAIFELHQAAERYFMTALLVYTDYKPKTHNLQELNKLAGLADAQFKTIFPNKTDKEKRLFFLLTKSYIDSRYKLGYAIAPEDLQWLDERVGLLKELTEWLCGEKIVAYEMQAG